jgi:RimJ/RimL family protein N-acetyltransferase
MFLRKYTDSDFPTLKSWVTDPDLLFTFAGGSWSYPLTFEQVKTYQEAHPLKQSYILCNEKGTPIAFGELISGEANSPRLGRLLVGGEENRGKGIGKILIHKMIEESRKNNDQRFIHLFVFQDNFMAIRCYENMGFTFVPEVVVPMASPQGHAASALLMTLTFDD